MHLHVLFPKLELPWQVERREAQLEHAKREAELLGQAKDGNLLDDSIQDTHFEQPQLFEAENFDSSQANGELPSEGSLVPEPRTIELTAEPCQDAEVPCELQGKIIQEPTDHSESKEVDAVDEAKNDPKNDPKNDYEISTKAGGVHLQIQMTSTCALCVW